MHNNALHGHTNLPLVHKRTERCRVDRPVQISIIQDYQGIVSAQLDAGLTQARGREDGDLLGGRPATGARKG